MRSLVIVCFATTLVGCSGMMMGGTSGSAGASAGGVSASTSSGGSSGGSTTAGPSDVEITGMVREALMRDSRIGRSSITVHTRSGVVELGGAAPDYEAREAAEKLAMGVDGVRAVNNRITVNSF